MAKQSRTSHNLPARIQPKLPGAARRSLALSNRGLEFLHKNDDGQKLDVTVRPASGLLPSVERRNVALWIREADRGESQAQYNVGLMFFKGVGVERDYEEAYRWFLKSAEQGSSSGQGFLGILYEQGLGVTQDLEESLKWYTLAVGQAIWKPNTTLAACTTTALEWRKILKRHSPGFAKSPSAITPPP